MQKSSLAGAMLNNHDRISGNNKERLEQSGQVDELVAQLRERVATLERENSALQAELDACQLSQESQARITELERAYTVLQAEVKERHRCEQVLQGRAQTLTRTLEALIAEPDLDKFLGQVLVAIAKQMGEEAAGLWLYDAGTHDGYLHLNYENGQVQVFEETDHPGTKLRTHVNQQLFENRVVVHDQSHFATNPNYAPYREYLRKQNIQSILTAPLFLGEEYLGAFTVRSTKRETYLPEEHELAHALTQQAVLAIQITRLSEAAKQAAIAREQEKAALERASELTKANAALRHSIDALTKQPSIEAFLSVTLQAIAEVLEVPSASLWKYEGEWTHLQLVCQNGSVILGEQSEHPNARQAARVCPNHIGYDSDGKYHTYPYFYYTNDSAWEYRDVYAEMFQELGVRCLLIAPIVIGDHAIATISARLTHDIPDPSPTRLELVNALASQAALALQMSQLAEEAKQAAIAREQEKAAQERAAELAKANEALRQSLNSLATEPDLDNFLGQVLKAILNQLGEENGGIWLYNHKHDSLLMHLNCEKGQIEYRVETAHPGGKLTQAGDRHKENHQYYRQNQVRIFSWNEISTSPGWEPYRDYFQECGIRSILSVPMFVGNEFLGTYSVRGTRHETYRTEEIELAQALANQAALALHVQRLADQVRERAVETAIAREQEKAALERIAELAKANKALKQSLDALATAPDLDGFLGQVLLSITQQLRTPSSTLWLYDNQTNTSNLYLLCQDGAIHQPPKAAHPNTGSLHSHLSTDTQHLIWMLERKPQIDWIDDPLSEMTPEQLHYLRNLGVKGILTIPLVLGEQCLGSLCVHLVEEQPPAPEVIELAHTLANQATLALELTRLAEEAKQSAIAREQEKAALERVAELAKANEALKQSLDILATEPDLDRFLGHVINVINQQLDAPGSTLWLYNYDTMISHLHLGCLNGEIYHRQMPPYQHHQFKDWYNFDRNVSAQSTLVQGKPQYIDNIPDDEHVDADTREWLLHHKVRSILSVPLVLGDRVIGSLTIHKETNSSFPEEKVSLAMALTQQATLALQLTRLAEESKQAAIAREQEKAAQERAVKLAKANEVLRASTESLSSAEDLDSFLGSVLLAITKQLGARTSTVWLTDDTAGLAYLKFVVEDGIVIPAEKSDHPNAFLPMRAQLSSSILVYNGTAKAQPGLRRIEEIPDISDEQRQYLREQGVRALLGAPMILNGQQIGAFTIRLEEDRSLLEEDLELIQALANQATLAIQLTRLAEEAKQAAIAREREEAERRRAEALERANTAMRASLEQLSQQQSLDSFLGEVVTICANELSAIGAGIWVNTDIGPSSTLIVSYEDGEVRHLDQVVHPGYNNNGSYTYSHDILIRGEIFIEGLETIKTRDWYPRFREYLEARNIQAICSIPLFLGDHWVGTIVLRYTAVPILSKEERELAQALGNQVALALELTRLAEEAKQAAIAREQEKAALERAAELAKANAALQASLSKLADEPELEKFLGHVLRVCAERLGAVGAGIWHFEAEIGYLLASYEDGEVKLSPETSHPGGVRAIAERTGNNSNYIRLTKREIWSHHEEDFQNIPNYEPYRTYLQQRGIKSHLSVPMFLGDSLRGSLTLRFDHRRTLKSEEAELAHALANQAVLALELTRLAEEAKQAAITREQEQAARERTAELAKANAALRHSIDALTKQPSIEAFLGVTLQAIAEVLEVPSACLWKYEGEWSYLQLVYQDGQIIPAAQSDHPNATRPSRIGKGGYDPTTKKPRTRPYYYQVVDSEQELENEHLVMFKQLDVHSLLIAPIIIGDRVVGNISARLTHDLPNPSPSRLELVNALANQAALALQMADLAEQAKQAALLEERNRLAGEIHDTLAQAFTGISIQLKVAKRIAHHDPNEVQKILDRASALAEVGLAEARRSVWALYPAAAEYSNLAQSLPRCIEQLANSSNTHIEVSIQGTPYPLAPIIGMNLLRIGQEAVLNALKHAQTETIWVELAFESTSIYLRIYDNGRGFALPTDDSSVSGGFGLLGMNQRAERIGGQLTITTEPGRGTEIFVQVRK